MTASIWDARTPEGATFGVEGEGGRWIVVCEREGADGVAHGGIRQWGCRP